MTQDPGHMRGTRGGKPCYTRRIQETKPESATGNESRSRQGVAARAAQRPLRPLSRRLQWSLCNRGARKGTATPGVGLPDRIQPRTAREQRQPQKDLLLVHQNVELLEVLFDFDSNNKYEIKNSLGQRIFFAAEDTDCCTRNCRTRNCCGPSRPFTMRIVDNTGREVVTLERPLRCSSCCCPCCLQEIEIQTPPGVLVGYVTQIWHPCLPKFMIQKGKREDVL
ncbi:PREDICTED: phospholipid scramblase 2-like, partial [Galeopterus variegatus]|uniref:Phospholipid scramblase n=1 Tax=Galeopterus variegatus TaxID=482537 RepID=A0ABM0S449_GALVR